ncbi:MAG: glycosyltransferase family 2 protein [Candidatus Kapaibacterium sp.]
MIKEKVGISCCMITKNEGANITQALNSVRNVCRQTVIVDTGSTDDTPRLAQKSGAEVHFFAWTGSFSDARNASLSFARCEWILILDADEEIDEESLRHELNLLEDNNAGGININIVNPLRNGETIRHNYTRLFRNVRGIKFEGIIHEQVRDSIEELGLEVLESDIKILHHGYEKPHPEKLTRNKIMLEKELKNNPGDTWLSYHLAMNKFNEGNMSEARRLFVEIHDSEELTPKQRENCRVRAAQAMLSFDEYQNVKDILDFSSDDLDLEGLRKFVLAAAFLMEKDIAAASELYNSYETGRSELVDRAALEDAKQLIARIRGYA